MLNVLIIDEDINCCKSLLNYISQNSSQLRVSAIATSLSEGIKILNSGLIDITLINLNCDINTIINSFNNIEAAYFEDYNDSMVIVSKSNTKKFTNHNYIHDFIYSDPDEMNNIILYKMNEIAKNKFKKKYNSDLLNKINKELKYIGYNLSYNGTMYLSESIALMYNNYSNNNNLNQKIYPIIAKKYNKTINNIKCCITKATSNMFYECEENRLKNYFCFYNAIQPKPKLVMYTVLNKLYSEE